MLGSLFRPAPPDLEAIISAPDVAGLRAPVTIFDAAALRDRLERLVEAHGVAAGSLRPALLAAFRETLDAGRAEIRRRFLEEAGGGDACVREHVFLMDGLIRALADVTVERLYPVANPTTGEQLALAAIGGYGRGELAPQSDIDLLFLLPYKAGPWAEQVVETMLYTLWDLGLKVGHAVRSVEECIRTARSDITVRTSLLESRPLWGARPLYDDLRRRFAREVATGTGAEFVEAKLAERDARHGRLGDSRYVLEPNIKEGKGGLRDLQTLFWIAKYLYQVEEVEALVERGVLLAEEAAQFDKAQTFLRTVRCHLHFLTGRPEERLTFDVQPEIGRRMGYTDHAGTSDVERFMKHYFLVAKEVGDLTRIFCAVLEAESRRRPRRLSLLSLGRAQEIDGFQVEGERLNVAGERQFRETPADMIRLFHVADRNGLDIHPQALKLITRSLRALGPKVRNDTETNRLFLEMLAASRDPELALRRMNEAGVLGRFIPDFGRVVAQMQYDMYHVFTVDEHTLFAIGIVHRILAGALEEELPLVTRVARNIVSRRALYVAVLLHDIAKGRGGDHSVLGAEVAEKLCPRLGLDPEETETVAWLVRWHLLMSNTALKRDIEDDRTIHTFAKRVESPERLRLLLVLTAADIRAVGPGRWNAWKGTLLGQLYVRTRDYMSGGFDVEDRGQRVRAGQEAARAALADWPAADIDRFLGLGYPPYWLSLDTASHVRHAALLRRTDREGLNLLVDHRIDTDAGITEVTILAPDHPGLFSQLAGALAVAGATIVDAKIFTLTNGLALDSFAVQDATVGGAFQEPDRLARLPGLVEQALAGKLHPAEALAARRPSVPARTKVFTVQPRVLIENEASATHTVIEINGRDRPGLLHDITWALSGLSLQIASAKISTYGERAVDVFYVKDIFGLKVTHESKLGQIRSRLLEVLGGDGGERASGGSDRGAARRGARRSVPRQPRARQARRGG